MSYFSTIYSDNSLPIRAKTVYMYLRDRSDKEHKCWPGINTIAAELNCSRSTVKRALHDLEKHDLVKWFRPAVKNFAVSITIDFQCPKTGQF